MTQRIVLGLLFCSILFVGCDNSTPDGDDPAPVLLPLDVGNQWVMAYTSIRATGEVTQDYTDTLRVVGDTTIADERWAEIACAQRPATCIPAGYYTHRTDGVWKWLGPDSAQAPFLLYKYPAETGDSYEQPSGVSEITTTVVGTDVPVEVPAGTLSGYQYRFDATEVAETPIEEGIARFDRLLVPGQGFASIGCLYLTIQDDGPEVYSRFGWELISFEGN